jgi:hypothetical protein
MKRLILTSSSGTELIRSDLADFIVIISFRFVGGPLPSPDELATYVAANFEEADLRSHWSRMTFAGVHRRGDKTPEGLELVEFCQSFETVELWFDPDPNDQLQLVWLLDLFSSHPEITAKLKFRHVSFEMVRATSEELDRWKAFVIDVTDDEFSIARATWHAYRSPTPEACFDLMSTDLSALPLLRPALLDLIEELPSGVTGLGATEMRVLELIANGYANTNPLFYLHGLLQRRVFKSDEIGTLLQGLSHGPTPAVAGLDDELRTIEKDNHKLLDEAYRRSRLSLTEFGKAVLAYKEDFSRHNPIDRWWGGTRLTNDNLWRWSPVLIPPGKH